ncbi:hypothetical protein [Azospirillum tabaci]|uniref:hypothetical protein n=1 Tax=Azospirillum tabaci TaxID=2752310 RepID=UPI001FE5F428|nr:hypothetical protein [Azospirillum tabaci]
MRTPTDLADPRGRSLSAGRHPLTDLSLADPARIAQARTLAGWIAVIAEDRGLDERGVAAATGLGIEDVRAVLDGTVFMMPVSTLDRALRRLEGRPH